MADRVVLMSPQKRIALIAHDNCKAALLSWARFNRDTLARDPLEPHPHDVDVKALLRVAVVHNVPIACNRSTADFLLSSPLMQTPYERLVTRVDSRQIPPVAVAT